MQTKSLQFNGFLMLILISTFLTSCAVQKSNRVAISSEYAASLFKKEAGTDAPDRKLYHTYEENYSGSFLNDSYNYQNILSFSKIEGNYVEGVLTRSGSGHNKSFPIFGRYNFDKLYIYTQGSPTFDVDTFYPSAVSLESQEIFVFQIGQNGRILTRLKYAYCIVDGVLNWRNEPQYNVDLDSRRNYDLIYSSTGFISKTDDYIGEEGKSGAPATQTLTDKLKELKDLLDQNVINQQEYDAARKKLLEM